MSFRNRFKRFKDQVKDKIGLEKSPSGSTSTLSTSQTNPLPLDQSHSPTPQTENAWKNLNNFRRVLDGIANGAGPLNSVMDQLGAIIDMYEASRIGDEARSGYAALRTELEELFSILSTHFAGNVPPTMTAGMNNLCSAIENELDRISREKDQRTARRLMEAENDLDEVMECYRRIQCHLERLKLNADLSMWKIVTVIVCPIQLCRGTPGRSPGMHSEETKNLVHDAWRFVTMFATNDISRSTAQLYVSMLVCWPRSEPLATCYMRQTTVLVKVEGSAMTRRQLALLSTFFTDGNVRSAAFSPDSKHIISASDTGAVRVWDAQSGKPLLEPLKGHTSSVTSVVYSPDGTCIISGSSDNTIRVWDAQTGESLLEPLRGHTDSVISVAYSPDNTRIVSGHTGLVTSVAYSPDGTRIVFGSSDHIIRVRDAQTGRSLLELLGEESDSVYSVAYSPDGTRIVSGSYNKEIRVWDAPTGKLLLGPLEGHTDFVRSVAYSPDGTRIVSSSSDNNIRVWDAQIGKWLLEPLEGRTTLVMSVAYSPDSRRIVSGSHGATIRVWNAKTGKLLLRGHTSTVTSVAYSPDGTRIVSGSYDNTIRVWDAQTGKLLLEPLEGHAGSINSVAYSPDGTGIASGSHDMVVRAWNYNKWLEQYTPVTQSPTNYLRFWTLDERGWVTDKNGRLLFWLPPDLRDRVVLPTMDCILSTQGYVTLDFEGAKLGESWHECYTPCPRI